MAIDLDSCRSRSLMNHTGFKKGPAQRHLMATSPYPHRILPSSLMRPPTPNSLVKLAIKPMIQPTPISTLVPLLFPEVSHQNLHLPERSSWPPTHLNKCPLPLHCVRWRSELCRVVPVFNSRSWYRGILSLQLQLYRGRVHGTWVARGRCLGGKPLHAEGESRGESS
jgi:hypothetical protein